MICLSYFSLFFILNLSPIASERDAKTAFAVTSNGDVFLLIPSSEKKIHHIDARGVILGRFGEEGPGENELLAPIDIIYWKNKLYLLDLFGPKIKVFSDKGKLLKVIGDGLEEDRKMKKPLMMRIHHDEEKKSDFIFVLDREKRFLIVFSIDGTFVKTINLMTEYEKYFDWMTSFNIDEKGNLWFTTDSFEDSSLRHVLVFSQDGYLIKELSMSKTARGGYLTDILLLPEGEFILADSVMSVSPNAYTGALIFFDSKGEPKDTKTIFDKKTSRYYSPRRLMLTSNGMYVLSSEDRLMHLNNDFAVLQSWSLR
jgi:hypothetical protein